MQQALTPWSFYRRRVSRQRNSSQGKVIHRIINDAQKIENQYLFNAHISIGLANTGGRDPFHPREFTLFAIHHGQQKQKIKRLHMTMTAATHSQGGQRGGHGLDVMSVLNYSQDNHSYTHTRRHALTPRGRV